MIKTASTYYHSQLFFGPFNFFLSLSDKVTPLSGVWTRNVIGCDIQRTQQNSRSGLMCKRNKDVSKETVGVALIRHAGTDLSLYSFLYYSYSRFDLWVRLEVGTILSQHPCWETWHKRGAFWTRRQDFLMPACLSAAENLTNKVYRY